MWSWSDLVCFPQFRAWCFLQDIILLQMIFSIFVFALKQHTQKRMWNGAAQISWAEQKSFAIRESSLSPFEQRPSLSSKRLVTWALKQRHWQQILTMFCHLFAQLCLIWVDFDCSWPKVLRVLVRFANLLLWTFMSVGESDYVCTCNLEVRNGHHIVCAWQETCSLRNTEPHF